MSKQLKVFFTLLGGFLGGCLGLSGDVRVENNWPGVVTERDYASRERQKVTAWGPIMEQRWEEERTIKAFRPLFVEFENKEAGTKDTHFLYPFFTRKQDVDGVRYNIFNLAFKRDEPEQRRPHALTVFPFYKSWKDKDEKDSGNALFPLGGRVENMFWHDSIEWFLFPLYLHSTKGDEHYYSRPWPFLRWRKGPKTTGKALWPFFGHYKKEGSYDHRFALWFILYHNKDHLDREVPSIKKGFLPFYAYESSEKVTARSWFWPFFGYVDKKDPQYHEDHLFWPLFVQGSGEEGRRTNRWAPFYTHSTQKGVEKTWYMWPFIKNKRWMEGDIRIEQSQLLYFLIWAQRQTSERDPEFCAKKSHFWPLHSYWNDGNGREQFQFLSPFEVFFPMNEPVRHVYSPIFALYRFRQEMPGHTYRSFLFNLLTYERSPVRKQLTVGPLFEYEDSPTYHGFKLLKGLFAYGTENGQKRLQIFWKRF